MEKPLLSIIVPVYNAQLTLRQCVDSILEQVFENYEIILINDGSIDDSKRICEDYARKDKRIVVINQDNQGVSAARNAGLDIARGDWITFVDSDDYITPNYFNSIDGFDTDIVFMEFVSLWKGRLVKNAPLKKCNMSFKSFIETYFNMPYIKAPWGKMIKRAKIGTLRFNEDMRIGEDSCFMYALLSQLSSFEVCFTDEYVFRCPDKELNQKYEITVLYAVSSLNNLFKAFKQLVFSYKIGKRFFFPTIQFYKYISQNEWNRNSSQWYFNKDISSMYRYVWSDLSIKQKIKLIGSYMLRK